jgi:hypothetical protein
MIPDDTTAFMNQISAAKDVEAVRAIADEVMALTDANKRGKSLVYGNHLNPFFVPHAKGQAPAINAFQFVYFISQARMAAANSVTPRIVVSAPMKSGSTFISESIATALKLPKISLLMLLARSYDYPVYGAGARPHEIDELALLSACMSPSGFVAHHHMVCSPYLATQAQLYNLKFVLLKRNIFDCIVSLDDFCLKNFSTITTDVDDTVYLRMLLPPGWQKMEDEARIHHLIDRFLHIYVHYHISWKVLERQGLVKPYWISYENELLADKAAMAARLGAWLGSSAQETQALAADFSRDEGLERMHFNKGVAGRGARIQGANRARVVDAFDAYKELADWSEILG